MTPLGHLLVKKPQTGLVFCDFWPDFFAWFTPKNAKQGFTLPGLRQSLLMLSKLDFGVCVIS